MTIPDPIPDTPAGRHMAWYLKVIETAGEGVSLADQARYAPEMLERMRPSESDEELREGFRRWSEQLTALTTGLVTATSDHEIEVVMDAADGKRWRFECKVEPEPPHRICHLEVRRALDESVTARLATEEDGPALAEIERRCPIELGEALVTIDRVDDWWAFARLMEDVGVGLALVDGRPAGMNCGAVHRVRVGGEERRMMVAVHLRILPEHQRKGLWGAANQVLNERFPWGAEVGSIDSSVGYVSSRNLKMQSGFRHNPNKWSFGPTRVVLDCRALAGPPAGRAATPGDAALAAEIINTCHGREELFLPYTLASLRARLERAPELYSWDRLWLTESAVVGVWPAGETIRIITERRGRRAVTRRALVLDYGFFPGAEAEFEALLRAWCAWCADRGLDELTLFTSNASPGCQLLHTLGASAEDFLLWMNGVAEPADAKSRGIYVDQVYF